MDKQERKKLAEVKRKEQFKRRLFIHRETMGSLIAMLSINGATITCMQEQAAGTQIEFEMNGLKFKLSGDV